MRKKIMFLLLIILLIGLKSSVFAITDQECEDYAKGDIRKCGQKRDCSYDTKTKKCIANKAGTAIDEGAKCAKQAKDSASCKACESYLKGACTNCGFEWRENVCVSINSSFEPIIKSCLDYIDEASCISNRYVSCLWIEGGGSPGYCNTDDLQYIKCGGAFDIPEQAPRIMSFAINLLKIGTPIILIITGIITLVKAVAASKEDDMKKAQSALIRKAVAAALVFFVISIVQFVLLSVADSGDESSISTCLSCFMNNDCDSNVYYKTKVFDLYTCHLVSNPTQEVVCGENDGLVDDIIESRKSSSTTQKSSSGGSTTHESSSGGSTTHESSSGRTHGGSSGNF